MQNLRMLVFGVVAEEEPLLRRFGEELSIELTLRREFISAEGLRQAGRIHAINVLADTEITDEMWDAAYAAGVRYAVTRCISLAHMNGEYARKKGIIVENVAYSPASVADYALMLMLMLLRNAKPILLRYAAQDYTPVGLRGRELPDMTVGVVGAGRIGGTLIRHLQGFGCRVLYWDQLRREELRAVAEYRELDELLASSDIVSLHLPLTDETRYLMDEARIARMKRGALLVNTGRGGLVQSDALIDALESGRLGGAALDVLDGDQDIYFRDYKNRRVPSRAKAILDAMPNVLMLPHFAAQTDHALRDMVQQSLQKAAAWWKSARRD